MSQRVNPELKQELLKYGLKEWNDCFHCGNCTAMCPLTEKAFLFPRKDIRALQLGLKQSLASSTDPWMCYYCGECSETCPRDANPGELMMAVRRYLTKIYDWTGLAGLLFKSKLALFIGFVLVLIGVVAVGFVLEFNIEALMEFGHKFEQFLIIAVLALIILPNLIHMFWLTIVKPKVKAPIGSYVTGLGHLIWNMFTQKRSLKCETGTFRWFEHLMIVIGYLLLLVVTVYLNWFSTESIIVKWLGYAAAGLVFVFTFHFVIIRMRKKTEVTKFSHPSDWLFVIWLFLMGFTAFLVRIYIDTNMIENNIWLYIIHLVVMAQWGILLVPFGKWTHFLYRSFAIYFANLKKSALQRQANL